MTQQSPKPEKNAVIEDPTLPKETVVKTATNEDLSRAIEQSVKRLPEETVKCVRVFSDFYRCNWRTQDKSAGPAWLSMGRITSSKMLKVTMGPNGLQIEDVSVRA